MQVVSANCGFRYHAALIDREHHSGDRSKAVCGQPYDRKTVDGTRLMGGNVFPRQGRRQTAGVQQMTASQLEASFLGDIACKAYVASRRWPDRVTCPRCGNREVYTLPTRPFNWQCSACDPNGYRFSVLVGTVFENSKIPLKQWFRVTHDADYQESNWRSSD